MSEPMTFAEKFTAFLVGAFVTGLVMRITGPRSNQEANSYEEGYRTGELHGRTIERAAVITLISNLDDVPPKVALRIMEAVNARS